MEEREQAAQRFYDEVLEEITASYPDITFNVPEIDDFSISCAIYLDGGEKEYEFEMEELTVPSLIDGLQEVLDNIDPGDAYAEAEYYGKSGNVAAKKAEGYQEDLRFLIEELKKK